MDDMDPRYVLRRCLSVTALALVLVAALPASGRVYQRTARPSSPEALAAAVDGRIAYRSAIRINGGAARLSVIGIPGGLRRACAYLRRAGETAAGEIFLFEGARLANGVILGPDRITRLMLIEPAAPDQCLLIAVEQSYGEYTQSRTPPAAHQVPDLPVYPNSTPRRSWYNAASRTSVEVFHTSDSPAAVLEFCRNELRGAGWSSMLRDNGGTLIFTRERQLCCVSACAGEGSTNMITMLHKLMDD